MVDIFITGSWPLYHETVVNGVTAFSSNVAVFVTGTWPVYHETVVNGVTAFSGNVAVFIVEWPMALCHSRDCSKLDGDAGDERLNCEDGTDCSDLLILTYNLLFFFAVQRLVPRRQNDGVE